jgi:hypothetical protein
MQGRLGAQQHSLFSLSRTAKRGRHLVSGLAASINRCVARCVVTVLATFLILIPCLTSAANNVSEKPAIIAGYLFNIAKFIDWSVVQKNTIQFCVLGKSEISPLLAKYRGRKLAGNNIEVRSFRNVKLTKSCDLIYIANTEKPSLQKRLHDIKPGVVTISQITGFATSGGIVELYEHTGRIAFFINNDLARKSGIKISSKLLALSRHPDEVRP